MDIPIFITKKAIKFAHGRISSLVAPREFPILQMYLLELASIESVAEPDNAAPINIGTVLISGTIDLVQISGDKPSRAISRFLPNHHKEKRILQICSGGAKNS